MNRDPDVQIKHCPLCCQDAIVYKRRWSIHFDTNPNRLLCLMSGAAFVNFAETGYLVVNVGQGEA